jgi:hypothetical protein
VLAGSVQFTQAAPAGPHVPGAVSLVVHVPPLQQPPLHAWLPEQALVHWSGVPAPLHAVPPGQSPAAAHPHAPPPVTVSHAVPPPFPTHVAQAPPVEPHVVCPVPALQVFVESQHPPLQVSPPAQLVEQTCDVVLHACPVGQSDDVLHPQVSFDRHTGVLPEQIAQVPLVPHAPFVVPPTHVVPLQQPPLQGAVAEHVVTHAWVVVSHAIPEPQSVAELHPHVPPVDPAMHASPTLDGGVPLHAAHVPPLSPHAAGARPVVQVFDEPQHPPLHGWLAEHDVVH